MCRTLLRVVVLLFAIVSVSIARGPEPDQIFFNGKFLTVDANFSVAEAVAVTAGRISAVGSTVDIRKLANSATKQEDLEGRTVIPGLIDNHMHYMRGASRWSYEARIDGVISRQQALEIIGNKARNAGPGKWVFVLGGWSEQQFADAPGGFTTEELDAAAPDNPVFIQKSYSSAYMNSLAEKELARSESVGEASGSRRSQQVRGSSRSGAVRGVINRATRLIPRRSGDERIEDVAGFNSALNGLGLTTVYDIGRASDGNFDPVRDLARKGQLTVRVFHSLRYRANNSSETDAAVKLIASSTPRNNDDWFGLIGIGEHTYGPMHDTYLRPSAYGDDVWEQFNKLAIAAADGGWQIHEHAMQDSTVSRILDIAERINRERPIRDLRWVLAHCDLISRANIGRAKKLGIVLAVHNKTAKPAMEDRDSPPVGWMQESGVVWGLGSDSTVVATVNPFHSLWWVSSGKVFPDKVSIRTPVSRKAALVAHTRSNAYLMFKEKDLGSIEVGKLADMVVLDRDYLTVAVDSIRDIKPVKTIVSGKIVYDAASGHLR